MSAYRNTAKQKEDIMYDELVELYTASFGKLTKEFVSFMPRYQQAIRDQGFGETRKDVLSRNIIDVSKTIKNRAEQYPPKFSDQWKHGNCMLAPSKEYPFVINPHMNDIGKYAHVPCFEYGVIKMTNTRYIAWELINIDKDTGSVTVRLMDYRDYLDSGWGIYCACTSHLAATEDKAIGGYKLDIWHDEVIGYNNIMSIIDINETRMADEKFSGFWNKIINWHDTRDVEDMESLIRKLETGVPSAPSASEAEADCLAFCFHEYIVEVNYLLIKNKPQTKRKGKKCAQTEITDEDPNERKTRVLNDIAIKSKKVPHAATEETIVHYRVAAWEVRGHVRTYKNGKQVFIKPSTHHRKALSKNNDTSLKTIIVKPGKTSSKTIYGEGNG